MNDTDNVIAVFTAPNTIELKTTSLPVLQNEYVCVKYLYCGICGSDYSVYRGYRDNYPISLGHEFIGQVISVGESVKNLMVGQYVISDFNYRCNKCIYCVTGRSHLCIDNDIGLFSNRGFAKYANILASYLVPINPPSYLPRACLIEPLSCVIHACDSINIGKNARILLCGGGGIGMLFCFLLCRVYGVANLTVAERNLEKAKLLNNHFNVRLFDKKDKQTFDLIIDCSNTTSGLEFALSMARNGDKVCVMSHLYGHETSFVYEQICKKELRCNFPLRNGERNNLLIAANYINCYWKQDDDEMLIVYNNVDTAFKEKAFSSCCKQIVCSSELSALCISKL